VSTVFTLQHSLYETKSLSNLPLLAFFVLEKFDYLIQYCG